MALVCIYDSTELDKQQLVQAFSQTDHRLEFIDSKLEASNVLPDAEVISVFVASSVTRELIEAMPRLRLIACRSTGFNNVDVAAAQERDITVVNVPTYGESTVAEYAFAMLLALQRKLPQVLLTENNDFVPSELTGRDLDGKVFGVIGTGHIGQKALKIAYGFSMEPIAYDVYPRPDLQAEYHFKYVELDDLLARADFISLHVPYSPATHHLLNRDNLAKTKPGAIIINTARGELIDTEALIELLDNQHLGGAVIDVIEGESLLNQDEETALLRQKKLNDGLMKHSVEISVLEKMSNVIVSPHNAYNTVEAIQRINNTTAGNIIDYWYGLTPNKVKPAQKPIGKLILVRHAESEWNALGKWTGLTDVHLSEAGFHQASQLGQLLGTLELKIDKAYCSPLIRTRETLEGMLNAAQMFDVEIVTEPAFDERDYGDYTGKEKWQIKAEIGDEAFKDLRRGWDSPIPGGETLKMVYERVVPSYEQSIWPLLKAGNNVLITAHGNSLRALVKYLESISDEEIANREFPIGQVSVYELEESGLSKFLDNHQIEIEPTKA